MENIRVSELVTIEEVNKWNQGDIVTIKAGTGAGKSYFIKNNLYAIAKRDNKRILMLIHRKNCTSQFLKEVKKANKLDHITIKTYQSIEAVEKSGIMYEFEHYDYIVCDEWHYFLSSDTAFNHYVDLSLNAILEQTNAIRIFMSATDDRIKYYLTDKKHKGLTTIDYELPIDFKFIKKLQFFYKNETLETYIEQAIELNEKAIFFIQSAKKAHRLYEKYKDHAIFNCSSSNEHYQFVDKQQIDDILTNEGFDKVDKDGNTDSTEGKLILITTAVMDAGLNIVDDKLVHIVVDMKDTGTLIQCIGRKRFKGNDNYINLYVKALGNKQLGGMETQGKNKLDMALYFIKNGEKKLVRKRYRKLNDNLIYDEIVENGIEKRLNKLMFYKIVADINEIEKIKSYKHKEAYCQYISGEVFNLYRYSIYEEKEKNTDLESYLDGMIGEVMLQSRDRTELIEKMNVRRDGKLLKGLNSLNSALEESNINFHIRQFETSRTIDGKKKNFKSAWQVLRLTQE